MTWISVNPQGEPFTRKSAALALTRTGDTKVVEAIDNLSPEELAELYNNAEALGLDLYSLNHKYPESNREQTP